MSPDLANAVDPIFLYVLETLDSISHSTAPSPDVVRDHLNQVLARAEAQIGTRLKWEATKYAVIVWTDEMLINAPWPGSSWWVNNTLEFSHFQTSIGGTQFFQKGAEVREHAWWDVLEVYYLCVVLGFRGFYNETDVQSFAEHLQLPLKLEEWADRTRRAVQLKSGRPPISETPRTLVGAPPLYGKYSLLKWIMIAVCVSALLVMVAAFVSQGKV